MNSMKELSRRSMYNAEEGMACGPCDILAIDAEIVLEGDDGKVYLHGQWIAEVGDEILFEATKESVYDIYEALNHTDFRDEKFDKLCLERDRICEDSLDKNLFYDGYFEEIKSMIIEKMEENDIEPGFDEDFDEYEESDEDDVD